MTARRFALVAGGGTGGHLLPAVTVGRALAAGHGPEAVEIVGSRRGLESDLLAGSGLPVTTLPGRGFARSWRPGPVVANVGAAVALTAALVMAVALVGRRRPSVVVAMGGYGCVPLSVAARLWGVPVVLVNLDAVPGAASRLVGRFAGAAAVAFPGTPLPRAVVTGAPVRPEIVAAAHPDERSRKDARHELGLPSDRFTVGVVGGSLGARRINEATLALAGLWAGRGDVTLYHVVGRRDADWVAGAAPAAGGEGEGSGGAAALVYRRVPYEERMDRFYRAADVVVARAGAATVAELTVVGVAAVLVPLPGAPGDHQTVNAGALVTAGAAVLVADGQCTGERLAAELTALRGPRGQVAAMAAAAAGLGRADAVAGIVAVVETTAGRRR